MYQSVVRVYIDFFSFGRQAISERILGNENLSEPQSPAQCSIFCLFPSGAHVFCAVGVMLPLLLAPLALVALCEGPLITDEPLRFSVEGCRI